MIDEELVNVNWCRDYYVSEYEQYVRIKFVLLNRRGKAVLLLTEEA